MQGLGDPVLLMNLGSNMRKDRMKKSWAVWFARSILVPISDMCVCVGTHVYAGNVGPWYSLMDS